MDIQHYIHQLGQQAREASRVTAVADGQRKNEALRQIATNIRVNSTLIFDANQNDLAAARAAGLEAARVNFCPGIKVLLGERLFQRMRSFTETLYCRATEARVSFA